MCYSQQNYQLMKQILLIIFMFCGVPANTQIPYRVDLEKAVDSQWGLGRIFGESFDNVPIPASGANQVWDFSFLGNVDNGNQVLFSEATSIFDFCSTYKFTSSSELATLGGGTIQDSFPNAIGCMLLSNQFVPNQNGFAYGQENDEIITFGEVSASDDIFDAEEYGIHRRDLNYNFPNQLEESIVRMDTFVGIGQYLYNSLDSAFCYDSIALIGFGTVKMYYGDVENVKLYRQLKVTKVVSTDLNTGERFVDDFRFVDYRFYQNENLQEILSYNFVEYMEGQPVFDGPDLLVPVPFFDIPTSTNEQIQIPIQLSLSPNPIINQGLVSFQLDSPAPVKLELISIDGKRVLIKNLGELGIAPQKKSLTLPDNLSTGMYLLKLSLPNGQSGVTKVIIK